MKSFARLFYLLLVSASILEARAIFVVTITPSATNSAINAPINFDITLRNDSTAIITPARVLVTFPASATLGITSNNLVNIQPGSNPITRGSGQVTFQIDTLLGGAEVKLHAQVTPTAAGNFTMTASAQAQGQLTVNASSTVTVNGGQSDLGVTVRNVPASVLVNDTFNYQITITNAGPATANQVVITTILPAGATILGVQPSVSTGTAASSFLINAGTLEANRAKDFTVTMQLANSTRAEFLTAVSSIAGETTDTVAANNSVGSSITAVAFKTNNLEIVSVSAQVFSIQTGLMEQTVHVKNIGTNTLSSVRLIATNLAAPNRLYNATGTNGSSAFIALTSPLPTNGVVPFKVHILSPTRRPVPVNFIAVEGPSISLTVPTGTNIVVQRYLQVGAAREHLLLEFPTTVGKAYTVVYSDNPLFTNALPVLPIITATSTRTQFIDDGPPKTASALTNATARFYRVIQNQ